MGVENHIPSLTHLREFTRARANNRSTHVARDREQVAAPKSDRFFSFVYEPFITGLITYVQDGNRGAALTRVVEKASGRMRPSYEAAAKGTRSLFAVMKPTTATRRQRNVVVVDTDGYELVSLRIHLLLEAAGVRYGAFMYFSEKALTSPELAIMDTAIALAVRQIDPTAVPSVVMVRSGGIRIIDPKLALTPQRIASLRAESIAYREAWSEAAG